MNPHQPTSSIPTTPSGGRNLIPAVLFLFLFAFTTLDGQDLPFSLPEDEDDRIDAVDYQQWFQPALLGFDVDGDPAAFNAATQYTDGLHGGIESLHLEGEAGENWTYEIDARAIVDLNDYYVNLLLSNFDGNYIKVGFKEFRVFYDGSGGYFPGSPFFSIFDEELAVDRSHLWLEAGYFLQEGLLLRAKLDYYEREGKKNSTTLGDTNNPTWGRRNIVPSFWALDESRLVGSIDLEMDGEKLDYLIGVRLESQDNDNARNMRRRPGESSDRYITDAQDRSSDLFSVHGFADYRIDKKTRATAGGIFTTIDTNVTGSRVIGPDYYSPFDPSFPRQNFDEGYLDLEMDGEIQQFVFNANILHQWDKHTTLVGAFRLEQWDQDAQSQFLETNFRFGSEIEENLAIESENDWEDISGELELRYTGVENAKLSARAFISYGEGDLHEIENDLDHGNLVLERLTRTERTDAKITLDAKAYPTRGVVIAAQYFYRLKDYHYDHPVNSDGPFAYPAFITNQDFSTHDVNLRLTWRPASGITSVSRIDVQQTEIETISVGNDPTTSGDLETLILSQSLSWMVTPRVFIYSTLNYVEDTYSTPATRATGGAANLVPEVNNDYLTFSLAAGYTVNDQLDLDAEYIWYEADNFVNNFQESVPYGTSQDQSQARLRATLRLSEQALVILQYAYFAGNDLSSGFNNDYNAHGLYGKYQYRW